MDSQPRTAKGKYGVKAGELKGDAIALRLPASLDVQVRESAGWSSKGDNDLLRAWVEGACKDRVSGSTPPASTVGIDITAVRAAQPCPWFGLAEGCMAGIDITAVRAAANRVALQTSPKQRGAIIKAFNALVGELLASQRLVNDLTK